jgi:class 3 adenylate cyclase
VRLCGEAKDGQILVSRRVTVAVEGTATLEEVGDLSLNGLSQASRRWRAQRFGEQFEAENRSQQEQCELKRRDARHGRTPAEQEPKYT